MGRMPGEIHPAHHLLKSHLMMLVWRLAKPIKGHGSHSRGGVDECAIFPCTDHQHAAP